MLAPSRADERRFRQGKGWCVWQGASETTAGDTTPGRGDAVDATCRSWAAAPLTAEAAFAVRCSVAAQASDPVGASIAAQAPVALHRACAAFAVKQVGSTILA